jgi:signal peptidase
MGRIDNMEIKTLKKIWSGFYNLLTAMIVVIAVITAFTVLQAPGGYRFFVVQSGSMEPKIKTGSVVLVAPSSEYKVGEVITYKINPNANLKDVKSTITHRIIEVQDDEGRKTFKTKGDANQSPDLEMATQNSVLGKVRFSIPYAGYAIAFTKTQTGFFVLIVIPATIIVYGELQTIKNEIRKLLEKRRSEKSLIKDEIEKEPKKKTEGMKNNEEKVIKKKISRKKKRK